MLWSLLKILLFVALVAALAFGATLLIESEHGLMVSFAGWEFTFGPLQGVVVAVLLLALVWLVLKLAGLIVAVLKFVLGDETAISRYFDRSRERRGFKALADGMLALASGDGREAISKAAKAERLLNRPELTNLLTAQAAEMSGDRKKAESTYKALLTDDRTRFVGVRGLMKQKLSDGDTDTALKLAEKAFALKPAHAEVQDTLLQLQAEKADWKGARKTLGAKLRHGTLPREVHRRRDAVLALSEARGIIDEDGPIEARESAIEANRLSPDLVPAAVMAARSYIEQGKARYATRVVKKAWEVTPHPDLATAFADIKPDETAQARLKRFKALTGLKPSHPETRMLLAELHIAAEDFPEARKALGDLAETDPTARSLTLVAAIERGQGADDVVVRGWLTKALTASRGPQWICESCGSASAEWDPVCGNCGSFDTLSWKTAPQGALSMPHSTEMLPLIVGAIEDKVEDVVEEVEPISEDEHPPSETPEALTDPVEAAEEEDHLRPPVVDAEVVEKDERPSAT